MLVWATVLDFELSSHSKPGGPSTSSSRAKSLGRILGGTLRSHTRASPIDPVSSEARAHNTRCSSLGDQMQAACAKLAAEGHADVGLPKAWANTEGTAKPSNCSAVNKQRTRSRHDSMRCAKHARARLAT